MHVCSEPPSEEEEGGRRREEGGEQPEEEVCCLGLRCFFLLVMRLEHQGLSPLGFCDVVYLRGGMLDAP